MSQEADAISPEERARLVAMRRGADRREERVHLSRSSHTLAGAEFRPLGRLAIFKALARLHLGELLVARHAVLGRVVVVARVIRREVLLFVDGGLTALEIDDDLTGLQLGSDLVAERPQDGQQGRIEVVDGPLCRICRRPAAFLHDGGVFLCGAHSAEALVEELAGDVRWDVVVDDSASRPAHAERERTWAAL